MNSISDIKIVGIDEDRPPRIRKEPYIDLFFKLSSKVPMDWCEDFNGLGRQVNPSVKIDKNVGLFVDAYVNDMTQIPAQLEKIKKLVKACNEQFLEKIRQKNLALAASHVALEGKSNEQDRLNQLVAKLNFDVAGS